MNNQSVIKLPASNHYTAEQALASSIQTTLTDVLIIGYDDAGDLFVRSSKMTRAEALFMLEQAKDWAIFGGNE